MTYLLIRIKGVLKYNVGKIGLVNLGEVVNKKLLVGTFRPKMVKVGFLNNL